MHAKRMVNTIFPQRHKPKIIMQKQGSMLKLYHRCICGAQITRKGRMLWVFYNRIKIPLAKVFQIMYTKHR